MAATGTDWSRFKLSDHGLSLRKGKERKGTGIGPGTQPFHILGMAMTLRNREHCPHFTGEKNRPREADFLKFILGSGASVIFHLLPSCFVLVCLLKLLKREGAALKLQTQTTTYTSLELWKFLLS